MSLNVEKIGTVLNKKQLCFFFNINLKNITNFCPSSLNYYTTSFDFNFALNKDVSWTFSIMLDRTLFQSEGPLINILYFDL